MISPAELDVSSHYYSTTHNQTVCHCHHYIITLEDNYSCSLSQSLAFNIGISSSHSSKNGLKKTKLKNLKSPNFMFFFNLSLSHSQYVAIHLGVKETFADEFSLLSLIASRHSKRLDILQYTLQHNNTQSHNVTASSAQLMQRNSASGYITRHMTWPSYGK